MKGDCNDYTPSCQAQSELLTHPEGNPRQTGSWLLPRAVPQQGGLEHKLRIPSALFSLPLVVQTWCRSLGKESKSKH